LEKKQEKTPEKEQKEQKPTTKVFRKKKSINEHSHYSSSSEDESEEESKEPAREQLPEKEYDANGNEVISTNEDIWKTNVEVEHTENEKMDDFINQLFM
jgi:singapore isolate B (sub-type 7) whole genome shotgun sequence assembly, scaffold_4